MNPSELDHTAMRLAIAASRTALAAGDRPFGATLVSPQGEVLMTAANNQVTTDDVTGHAEMVLVRQASSRFGARALRGATVYASGEPCAMCAGAMFLPAAVMKMSFLRPVMRSSPSLSSSPMSPVCSQPSRSVSLVASGWFQ